MSSSSGSDKNKFNIAKSKLEKYLLLLDINGPLCHRLTNSASNRQNNDFRYKCYNVYKRPNLEYFIGYLDKAVSSSSVDVYFYTSIMKHNAKAMLKRLLPGAEQSHFQHRIFDRSWNIILPSYDENKKETIRPSKRNNEKRETMRDLNKIWERLPEFNSTNTIVLDNSADKCKNFKENSIIIPPFVEEDTLMILKDDTLIKLTQYFTSLFDSQPEDVRMYLRDHPFESFIIETHEQRKHSSVGNTIKSSPRANQSDCNGDKTSNVNVSSDSIHQESEKDIESFSKSLKDINL